MSTETRRNESGASRLVVKVMLDGVDHYLTGRCTLARDRQDAKVFDDNADARMAWFDWNRSHTLTRARVVRLIPKRRPPMSYEETCKMLGQKPVYRTVLHLTIYNPKISGVDLSGKEPVHIGNRLVGDIHALSMFNEPAW